MTAILVDSNIILDVITEDPTWYRWSSEALASWGDQAILAINPIIYGEVSVRFSTIEELEETVSNRYFQRFPLPWEAAFLAAKCFVAYRRKGGSSTAPLPDFYIGAHAAISGLSLLTRDASRFRTYFPGLEIIAP